MSARRNSAPVLLGRREHFRDLSLDLASKFYISLHSSFLHNCKVHTVQLHSLEKRTSKSSTMFQRTIMRRSWVAKSAIFTRSISTRPLSQRQPLLQTSVLLARPLPSRLCQRFSSTETSEKKPEQNSKSEADKIEDAEVALQKEIEKQEKEIIDLKVCSSY